MEIHASSSPRRRQPGVVHRRGDLLCDAAQHGQPPLRQPHLSVLVETDAQHAGRFAADQHRQQRDDIAAAQMPHRFRKLRYVARRDHRRLLDAQPGQSRPLIEREPERRRLLRLFQRNAVPGAILIHLVIVIPQPDHARCHTRQHGRHPHGGLQHFADAFHARRRLGHLQQHDGNPGLLTLRFVSPRRVDGYRHLIGQRLHDEYIIRPKRAWLGALHVEHTQHHILDQQRHGQLGARVGQQARIIGNIARLVRHIIGQQTLAVLRHPAQDALTADGGRPRLVQPALVELTSACWRGTAPGRRPVPPGIPARGNSRTAPG